MPYVKKPYYYLLAAVCFFAVSSCHPPEYLSEKELFEYVAGNEHLSKSARTGNVEITVRYKPADLLVAQELRSKSEPSPQDIANARNKYSNYHYFIISFSHNGKEVLDPAAAGMNHFSDLLQTLSFRMAEVVNLTTPARDTVPVADYVYNRSFGMSNSTDLLFVFDKQATAGHEWIQVNIDEFGLGAGKHFFRFEKRHLENVPRIFKI